MCGITGVASTRPVSDRRLTSAGRDTLAHRGPDDVGEYWSTEGRVGFGHRRLSIVDLSPSGHQPMASADGQVWIVYNGEIYNHIALRDELVGKGHAFRSTSDTEVVLAAYREWGLDFLDKIEGMYALALYDSQMERVLLARDRAGEKPLFYRRTDGQIRFASELKALLQDRALSREIDPEALDCYLALGYVPGERCILSGFSKLPAGHALLFELKDGSHRIWPYWQLPAFNAEKAGGELELTERLETLLEDAVRRQLIADVPVGLLLSGGVDSSLITALAVRGGGTLKTYTVGFRQFPDYDETHHASFVAGRFGTDHTTLEADEVGPGIMTGLARQYDEPIIDSSMIPTYLVTQQIRKHCKVALGGDGGDELFGGYHSASRVALLQQRLRHVPLGPRRAVSRAALRLMPSGMKGRALLGMLGTDMERSLPHIAVHFGEHARRRLMGSDWVLRAEEVRAARIPQERDAVQRMTRFDFANYMAEDILVKVDRAAMLNSLEIRSPFLDRRVVEFAFGAVPSVLKATPNARKILLRKLAARILPEGFDAARKQGFGIPINHWLKEGVWRRHFEELLFDPGCIFERSEVERLFGALDRGRPVKEQLFGLGLFEHWRRGFGAVLPC